MSNDILRRENKNNLDDSVSSVSFGDKPVKKNEIKSNSLLSFFKSERKEFTEKLALEETVPTEKPKLYEPLMLFIELITISALLIYFSLSVNNVFFAVVLIAFTGLIIPISMVFFFYRLNTRWKIKTSLIAQLFAIGVGAYLILNVVFDKLIKYSNNYVNLVMPIKSVVEISVILLIVGFAVKGIKRYNVMSVLLISCIVSAGFSASKSMVEMFETLFIRVQISNNGITSAVGAIINSPESVKISIKTLLRSLLNISVFKSAIFISLTVINGFVLRHLLLRKKGEKSPLGLVFLLCFTMIVTAFSSVTSSITFMQTVYVIICILATGYALYHVIEYSVKNENYI